MKNLLVLVVLAASLVTTVTAQGRTYRWCLMEKSAVGGGHYRCAFATHQQCMASRSSNGDQCMRNPAAH